MAENVPAGVLGAEYDGVVLGGLPSAVFVRVNPVVCPPTTTTSSPHKNMTCPALGIYM